MATQTPMVGFATGGIPEVVEHQKSGYLASKGDVQGVVEGLRLAFHEKRLALWGAAGRKKLESHYTHEIFLESHLRLYGELTRQEPSSQIR